MDDERSADERSIDELRIAVMRLARRIRLERADGDVTEGQLSVLFLLHKHGPLTLGALSEHDRVTAPSMNRTVNRLEETGFVTRQPAPDDGRKVLIDLTASGRSLVTATRERRVAWFSHRLADLDPDDRAVLRAAAPVIARLADS